jgi:hypothetical protein
MNKFIPILVFSIMVATFTSCSLGGFKDIGEEIDPAEPMGEDSTSYMRTEVSGNDKAVELITIEDPDAENSGMIAIMRATDDDAGNKITAVLTRATYIIDDPNITIYPYIEYRNEYKYTTNPGGSYGASQSEFDEGTSETHSFDVDDPNAELVYSGNRYKRIDYIYQWIIDSSLDKERDMMKMYELTIMASHCKIDGFGGMGMLSYLTRPDPVQFKGIRAGTFDLDASGGLLTNVTTTFEYIGYSDYAYMYLDGTQVSVSDNNGAGSMSGSVDATVTGNPGSWNVNVDYSAISIVGTLPDGTYGITIDSSATVDVDAVIFTPGNFDYTGILDPDPASWPF